MSIPQEQTLDSSLALKREGYMFVTNRCRRFGSDSFRTRLMFKPFVCMQGPEAAALVYGSGKITRQGGMPDTVLKLLQDEDSVQQLDGDRHRLRKEMFMSMMSDDNIDRLRETFRHIWLEALDDWQRMERLQLMDAARNVLFVAATKWAGLKTSVHEVHALAGAFADMVEEAGHFGWGHWWTRLRRSFIERRLCRIIQAVRSGGLSAPEGSALQAIAGFRRADGTFLPADVAAVELINVIRPTVAVAWYIAFSALALHRHPETAAKIADGDDDAILPFVEEVRRYFPFFPFIGGVTTTDIEWHGEHLSKAQHVLLDIHGTNHDPKTWREPERFEPERFAAEQAGPFEFIPQGGGSHATGHRCPGERVTITLMAEAVKLLTREMSYDVPDQDLEVSLSEMPTKPASGFQISLHG